MIWFEFVSNGFGLVSIFQKNAPKRRSGSVHLNEKHITQFGTLQFLKVVML